MIKYFIKRLCLLPFTLLVIFLINFVILNFASNDSLEDRSIDVFGDIADTKTFKGTDSFLQFREHYGLTLPILVNNWPNISRKKLQRALHKILEKDCYDSNLYRTWGDRAKFIMPLLLQEANNNNESLQYRSLAIRLLIRGGIRSGTISSTLSQQQKLLNHKIALSNSFLSSLTPSYQESELELSDKIAKLTEWFQNQGGYDKFSYKMTHKLAVFFFETRLCKYFSKIVRLDFGVLKNDRNQTVVNEVVKRLKSSLVLSVIPTLIVFIVCQLLGLVMAIWQNRWLDHCLNFIFLLLFSIPVYVAVPLLIDKCVLNKTFPFTNIPMPYSGLSSPKEIFVNLSSGGKILDVILHSLLPFIAVSYGSLSAQSRFARSAFLEVFKQDYVRTAIAKGLSKYDILVKHVGRNAALTMITSLSSSFGIILGGSLVVETLFQIDGFGKFFYQAILNRDHNVILFSVFVGSGLSLLGYLIGDFCYVLCDPRLQLSES